LIKDRVLNFRVRNLGWKCLLLFLAGLLTAPTSAKEPIIFTTIQSAAIPHICEDVLRAAYKKIGETLKVERYPGKRSLRMANTGVVAGEVCRLDTASSGMSNLRRIPTPISHLKASVFSKGDSYRILGWPSLSPYKIGILKGILFSDEPTRGMRRYEALNIASLFAMLNQGRVDMVVFAKLDGQHYLKSQSKLQGIEVYSPPLATLPLYHYLHNSQQQLIPKITEVLLRMERSGEIDAIIEASERRLLQME